MKRVLITGASSDIGLSLTQRYLDAGWSVIGHYRTWRDELDEFDPDRFDGWQFDFADYGDLENEVENNAERFSGVDALVTLAAEVPDVTFGDATAEDYARIIGVNVAPGLVLSSLIGPSMVERNFGRIVHAGSIGVKFGGSKSRLLYSFSKYAVEFIPAEVRSWASRNVLVNIARIGVTDTRIHAAASTVQLSERAALIPAGRLAQPQEIANALYWLGSEENTYITNETIAIAGGE